MNPAVCHYLDASTDHLPPQVLDHLTASDGVIAEVNDYGAWLWVPDVVDERVQEYEDVPSEIVELWRFARDLGCNWVKLDADADAVDGLPTFDRSEA